MVRKMRSRDKSGSFGRTTLPQWYKDNNEPTSQAGKSKGLTVIMDAHSNLLSAASVEEDFSGFITLIHCKSDYPVTTVGHQVLKPGHVNNVGISVTRVKADEDIREIATDVRLVYV